MSDTNLINQEDHIMKGINSIKIKHIIGTKKDFKVITPLKQGGYAIIYFKEGKTGTGIPSIKKYGEYARVVGVGHIQKYSISKHQYDLYLNNIDNSDAGRPDLISYGYWKIDAGMKLVYKGMRPQNGKIAIEMFSSPSSVTNAKIFINNICIKQINLKNDNTSLNERKVLVYLDVNDNETVNITIMNDERKGKYIYVKSVGYSELKNMTNKDATFDTYESDDIDIWYTNSTGANDFALYDSDEKGYCLSYHGGEQRIDDILFLGDDGAFCFDSTVGKFSKKIEIHQKTKLANNKLTNIETIHKIVDGGYALDTAVHGNVNTSCFYTFMNCTNPELNSLYVPKVMLLEGTDEDLHEPLSFSKSDEMINGVIIQGNNERTVESRFTIFKDGTFYDNGILGAYIRKHTAYLKPYYGWHKTGVRNLKELSFSSIRLYT
jgi:hypothetical protein